MSKTTFALKAVSAALLFGVAASASALSLTAGNYKITFDNYDSGTVGYGNTAGVKCTTVAACDTAAGLPAAGSVGSSNLSADTMGILSVAVITNISTGATEYTRGTTSTIGGTTFGPYLTGVFGNLDDHSVEVQCSVITGCTTTALSYGGNFKLFSNAADYDPTIGPSVSGGVDLNAMMYTGISSGTLFLEGAFGAGAVLAGDLSSTYLTNYNNGSYAGNGQGFLDFTGGAALSFFDTNSLTNANGGKNDALLTVTFDDVNGAASGACGAGNQAKCWLVKSAGQVSGQVIPEPASMLLAGLGLLAAAGVSRRRKA